MRNKIVKDFDFKPIGLAIKDAREAKGITQERMAEILDVTTRYYSKIENEGQYPSFHVLNIIVRLLQVPLDEHFLTEVKSQKTARRRRVDALIDTLSEHELKIIEGTIKGILSCRKGLEQEKKEW